MMRARWIGIGAGSGIALMSILLPRWTAANEEAARQKALEAEASHFPSSDLPLCPPAGAERDSYLNQLASSAAKSGGLWFPVCRIAKEPAGKILIVATNRNGLAECQSQKEWFASSALCALEEPVAFLADNSALRTLARKQLADEAGEQVIWQSTHAMAWSDHLIAEHQRRAAYLLGLFILSVTIAGMMERTRRTLQLRQACCMEGDPALPRGPELLLLWVLGKHCRSLPGDLKEEYLFKLESGWREKQAKQWYWWQVVHSVPPFILQRLRSAFFTSKFPAQ